MNQCANAILALGAKPIMAEHPDEVMEITKTASSLLLNLGNITDSRISSMRLALKEANTNGIPYCKTRANLIAFRHFIPLQHNSQTNALLLFLLVELNLN